MMWFYLDDDSLYKLNALKYKWKIIYSSFSKFQIEEDLK